MVPRVGGVAVKASGPEKNLVLVVHTVFIIVLIKVVSGAVVVVVERCRDVREQLNGVGKAVAVPVVIGPVHDAVVVVVKGGLLFTPETTGDLFLVNVKSTVVVVIGVFTVGDTVVVVVNVVEAWRSQTLGHDPLVPHRLVEAVVVGVGVVAVVVVVNAVQAGEEVPVVLAGVVIEVEVAVDFEEVPDTVVVVVDVKPVKDGVVVIVEVNGRVGEVTVNVAVNIVLEKVSTEFIGEVGLRAVVAVPLPNTGRKADPGDVRVAVVGHLRVGDAGVDGTVATEVVVPTANALDGCAAPVARGAAGRSTLVKGCIGTGGVRGAKLSVHAVEGHLVGESVGVATDKALSEVTGGPTAHGKVVRTAHLDVMHVEDAVVTFVLVPPIGHAVSVLINVQTVDE